MDFELDEPIAVFVPAMSKASDKTGIFWVVLGLMHRGWISATRADWDGQLQGCFKDGSTCLVCGFPDAYGYLTQSLF